jgi:hypothetical protein
VARSLPATVVSALALIGFVLLLTPTGSLPSPRWRWWAWVAAAVLVTYQVAFAVTNLAVVVAAGSLVVRFRRAQGVERQQLRWVALAAALVSLAAVVIIAALAIGAPVLVGWVAGICVATLPLAIAAAVLRYRLYDLDRIVSRALAYGLLTLLLGGGYAGVVLGLGQLLGRASSLAVAGATLAVAAVFQPARRRVQRAVDRRFNRRRHDAAQTIQAFSARLRQLGPRCSPDVWAHVARWDNRGVTAPDAHGVSVTCSGVTGTPSLHLPMKRCSAVPPSAKRQSRRAIAQRCNPSRSFHGP